VDLCREDHDSYYHGYSNGVLWPVFHYRLDLADFNASHRGLPA
jgi:trehalose 6-phosphate synthase